MTPPAPEFIASDVDGTLLDYADFVPGANREVIVDAMRAGAVFVIATGRPPRWVHPVIEQLGFAPLAVCANGAVTVDTATGEIIDTRLLVPEELRRIDEVLRSRLPMATVAAERIHGDAADEQFVATPDYEHAWLTPEHLELGHEEVLAAPVFKLMARDASMTSSDMVAALAGELTGVADVTYSTDAGLIEFSAPGVSKASGLQAIRDRIGASSGAGAVGVPRTVAFGDMPNDIEMLGWADLGVAMGNAVSSVRAAADEVTLTNDEAGVAHILRRWW